MLRTPITLAVILIALGLVWVGQATRLLGGGFMVGDSRWGLIGAGCVVVGSVLALRELRRHRA